MVNQYNKMYVYKKINGKFYKNMYRLGRRCQFLKVF